MTQFNNKVLNYRSKYRKEDFDQMFKELTRSYFESDPELKQYMLGWVKDTSELLKSIT